MSELSVSTASPLSTSQESASVRRKLRRNRVILSCQQCHKRKQQCDRGHPCSRCVNRGCADACTYEEPKEVKKRKFSGTESGPIQDNFESAGSVPNQGQLNGSDSANNVDPNALVGLDTLLQELQNPDASNNTVSTPSPDSFDFSGSPTQVGDNVAQVAATAINELSQPGAPDDHYTFAGIAFSFRSSRTPSPVSQLENHFPDQKITAFLLSYYFDRSSAHWMFCVIHRPCFESSFRSYSSGELPPTLDFIALLSITCATALQFLPETDDDHTLFADYAPGRKVLQQSLVDLTRSVLFTCNDYPLSSLERIQALILFAMYQWNGANAGESWYIVGFAVRMAQALSLNRDGTTTWRMRPDEAEIRRRLWWTLFVFDRFFCMEYRRPYIISEQHFDVALPMNLDQADIVDTPDLNGKAVEDSTDSLYHLYHCQFRKLSGHMWDQCFSTLLPTYRSVMDWEEKLKKFELDVPTSLRYQTTQMATARPYLSLQYQAIAMEVFHHRMVLLRPFLFTHPLKDGEFEGLSVQDKMLSKFHKLARSNCVTFCKRLLAAHQMLQSSTEHRHLTWSSMPLTVFKSALSIGIAIIMDAQNPENEELEEWLAMAQGILLVLRPYNALAQRALDHLQVIRKRTLFVLSLMLGRCAAGDPVLHATHGVASPMSLPQRLDRTTRTLSQPPPCLADLLGREEAMDPFWSTSHASVFAGHFPGIESLIGPVNLQNLKEFLDGCLSMHSRLPHTCTV